MLIEINPGRTHFMMNGVLYKVTSVIDENNVHAVVSHPAAARGQDLPPNISVLNALGANAVCHALGPSRVLGQFSNIMPPNQ
jgi:hypothetical protein